MNINPIKNNYSFKGYDALPLKAIHIQDRVADSFFWELEEIGKKEDFEVRYSRDIIKWTQDHKTIIEKKGQPFMLASYRSGDSFFEDLRKKYNISGRNSANYVTGGNCFIGKNHRGEKWMLVGREEFLTETERKEVGKEYGIKPKNIIEIPQHDFHLDMFMRPIGYPFILVNNPKLVKEKLRELNTNGEFDDLEKAHKEYEKERAQEYEEQKKVITKLKKMGFYPIEIAGVYGSGINFMNAIVNQHPNGSISYITNGTDSLDGRTKIFQDIFEQDLKELTVGIDKVYFVNGVVNKDDNFLMKQIKHAHGGLHCMSAEEPNFDMWV